MAKKIIHLNLKNAQFERTISGSSDTTDNTTSTLNNIQLERPNSAISDTTERPKSILKPTPLERTNSAKEDTSDNITSIEITSNKLPEEFKPEVMVEKIPDKV